MNVGFPSFRMPVSFCDDVISESPAQDIALVKKHAESKAGEVLQLVRLLEKMGKLTPENFLAGRFEDLTPEQFADSSVKWGTCDDGNVFIAFYHTAEEGKISEETKGEFVAATKPLPAIGGGVARFQDFQIRGAIYQMGKLESLINKGSEIFPVTGTPFLAKRITLTLFKP